MAVFLTRFNIAFISRALTSNKIIRTQWFHSSAIIYNKEQIVESPFPDVQIPTTGTMSDLVFSKFDKYGDRAAFVDRISGRSYSFQYLLSVRRKIGSSLSRMGFKKGDVFSIYSPNCVEYFMAVHGVASIGGSVSPINPNYTIPELTRQLTETGSQYLLTVPSLAYNAISAAKKVGIDSVYVVGEADGCIPFSNLLDNDGSSFPEVNIDPKNDAMLLPFSSGTTGLPKGVVLTHYCLSACLTQISYHKLVQPVSRVAIGLLPMFHVSGLFFFVNVFPYQGVTTVLLPYYSPELFLETIQKYKIGILPLVPPLMLMLAKSPLVEKYDLTSVEEAFFGAAPSSSDVIETFKARFPSLKTVKQLYGMTELGPCSHCMYDGGKETDGNETGRHVGTLLPNTQCKVIDVNTGKSLGPNENGEICVRGPQLMKGYLNNPQATTETIDQDGWLHTGDIGYYDEDKDFYIVDRLKELIKYKGAQIAPAELECLLLSHPDVLDVAVVGVKDPEAGEVPKAFVVRKGSVTEEEIVKFVEINVASFKKLRGGVQFIKEIPKSQSGKILRKDLVEK